MEEELSLFFKFLENDKKVSNNTLQSYERDLKQYEKYLNEQGKEYQEETDEGIKNYITHMQEIGKKSSTISRGLASIRSFYQYVVKNKEIENDPTEGISSPKIEKRVPSVLTSNEVALLLDQPKAVDLKGTRDKAMLEFAYATGMRVTEINSSYFLRYRSAAYRTRSNFRLAFYNSGGKPRTPCIAAASAVISGKFSQDRLFSFIHLDSELLP